MHEHNESLRAELEVLKTSYADLELKHVKALNLLESEKKWRDTQCQRFDSDYTNLEKLFEKEKTEKELLQQDFHQYDRLLNVERNNSGNLNAELCKLQESHIRSVNSVGTGLDPITDQELKKRFQGLQDKVAIPSTYQIHCC